jgi:hypothetical protein
MIKEFDVTSHDENEITPARELAINILMEFEELLESHSISIPDVDREGGEDEARLYGRTYYALEDGITGLIDKFVRKKKSNF